jgi:hypothetical protein
VTPTSVGWCDDDTAIEAIAVPFTKAELALVSNRAAAHRLTFLEFVRFCVLTTPTPLEAVPRAVDKDTR